MKCKICNTENQSCFSSILLKKHEVKYYQCNRCEFLQTEEPYWLDEAYSESINISDTGYMVRNIFFAKQITILLLLIFDKKGMFLDYAGGYGVFVRLMRDVGLDFYWDDKYTKNIFSSGFEWDETKKIDAVTSFEAFEHFVNPLDEIKALLSVSDTIIFSTELLPETLPKPTDWWYYGLEHGQHISFYSSRTFTYIADKYNLNYYKAGAVHILTCSNIPKWKLLALRFSKLGFHKILAKGVTSKTWDDHHKMTQVDM